MCTKKPKKCLDLFKLVFVCFSNKGPCGNTMTQSLLNLINKSGQLFMVPAMINETLVIRFAIVCEHAKEADIDFAWEVIKETRDRMPTLYQASEDVTFDKTMIYDQQRFNLMAACGQRNQFHRMISDKSDTDNTQ